MCPLHQVRQQADSNLGSGSLIKMLKDLCQNGRAKVEELKFLCPPPFIANNGPLFASTSQSDSPLGSTYNGRAPIYHGIQYDEISTCPYLDINFYESKGSENPIYPAQFLGRLSSISHFQLGITNPPQPIFVCFFSFLLHLTPGSSTYHNHQKSNQIIQHLPPLHSIAQSTLS